MLSIQADVLGGSHFCRYQLRSHSGYAHYSYVRRRDNSDKDG